MKGIPLFLACACAASLTVAGCGGGYTRNWEANSAMDSCDLSNTAPCKEALSQVFAEDPLNLRAVEAMGTILEAEGKYEEAEPYYQEVYQRAGMRTVSSPDGRGEPVLLKDMAEEKLQKLRLKIAAKQGLETKAYIK